MKLFSVIVACGLACSIVAPAEAAKKKSDYKPTAEQRKKAFESGLKACRKKYGARLHFVRVEKYYGKWSTVCYHY